MDKSLRIDFSEGIVAQIPRDRLHWLTKMFDGNVIHDVRFRLSAYKYYNLLCFFRVDADDGDYGFLDEENASLILKSHGKSFSAEELRAMGVGEAQILITTVIHNNYALSNNKTHLVQLPAQFLDYVMSIVLKYQQNRCNCL